MNVPKTYLALSILSISCIGGLTTCKKYPEDDKITLGYTVNSRLCHTWQLTSCMVDWDEVIDVSHVKIYYESPSKYDTTVYTLRDLVLKFKLSYKDDGVTIPNVASWNINTIVDCKSKSPYAGNYSCGMIHTSEWKLLNNKKEIAFTSELFITYIVNSNHVYNYYNLFNLENTPWVIRKLTNEELIIETHNSLSQLVKMKFKRLF